MKSILGVLGVLFATFVLIPWITVGIIECVKGFFDENEMTVIQGCETLIDYVEHMKTNTGEYAMSFDLRLLAQFLSINIYIFRPRNDANEFTIDNTKTVAFHAHISPFGREDSSQPYITVVRNGSHYEPAMTNAAGRVWLLSDHMRHLADEAFNSTMDDSYDFCNITEHSKLPTMRGQYDLSNPIHMRDIKQMRDGKEFTDLNVNGFVSILNYKYKDEMDYANTHFLHMFPHVCVFLLRNSCNFVTHLYVSFI